MKKILGYVLVSIMFILPTISFAAEFKTGENVSVGINEKIINDVYLTGASITSAGNVTGDLFTIGGNAVISGDVSADVIAGGGNITILSDIGDDLRVGGGTIVIGGKIGGDLLVGGGQVTVSGAGVGGDVAIGAGTLRIDAPIKGDLLIAGGDVYINTTIGGDVKIEAEKVTLGSGTIISGNVTYKSTKEMIMEEGAIIKGTIDFQPISKKSVSPFAFLAIFSTLFLVKFLTVLACALLIGLGLRRYIKDILNLATKNIFTKMGRGFMFIIIMPILSLFLLATVIGIPFGILGILGFIIVMIFSCIITPIILGSVVYGYFSKRELEVSWKTILLGVLLYMILGIIPFIGWLAQTLVMFTVLGSVVTFKWQIFKQFK